jgi:hypothetical protein
MLKKLKPLGGGLYLWAFELRIGEQRFHRHLPLTEKAAHKMVADLLEAKAREAAGLPHDMPSGGMTLGTAAADYQRHMATLGRDAKHITDTARSLDLLRSQVGDACQLARIGRAEIIKWQEARKAGTRKPASPRTMNKALAEVRSFFAWCLKSGLVEVNPAAAVPKVREMQAPPRSPRWADFCRLVDYMWEHRPRVRDPQAVCLLCDKTVESGGISRNLAEPADVHEKRAKLFQERYLKRKSFGNNE